MLEQPRKRTPERTPIRIRPPDQTVAATAIDSPNNGWSSQLAMPDRNATLPRWLSLEQVRKMQRMRRETVVMAMNNGELPFEQRGRIRYVRLTDVMAWEEKRTKPTAKPVRSLLHPDLASLV